MDVLPVCIFVHHCAHTLWSQKRALISWNWSQMDDVLPCVSWQSNLGPLEEQPCLNCWAASPVQFNHWDLSSCAVVNKELLRLISTPSCQSSSSLLPCSGLAVVWWGAIRQRKTLHSFVPGCESIKITCGILNVSATHQTIPTLSWSALHFHSSEPPLPLGLS